METILHGQLLVPAAHGVEMGSRWEIGLVQSPNLSMVEEIVRR